MSWGEWIIVWSRSDDLIRELMHKIVPEKQILTQILENDQVY